MGLDLIMKKILLLGLGAMQIPLVKKAKEKGCYLIGMDGDFHAPAIPFCDEFYPISTLDFESISQWIESNPIDGIATASDAPVQVIAQIVEKFPNLHGPSVLAGQYATSKDAMRSLQKAEGLEHPKFILLSAEDQLSAIQESIPFPCVVKPVDSSGSRGVQKVNTFIELEAAISQARHFSRSQKVLVEEYLIGRELSIESWSDHQGQHHIVALTQKWTSEGEGDFFVEIAHQIPAILDPELENAVNECVLRTLNAMEARSCINHTEVKICPDGKVYVIESAMRPGGDFIASHLVPLATGVDLLGILVDLALGIEPSAYSQTQDTATLACAIRFFTPPIRTEDIAYFSELHLNQKLIEFEAPAKITSQALRSSFDRSGYAIATAKPGELQELLRF